jgi:hypothetical protein
MYSITIFYNNLSLHNFLSGLTAKIVSANIILQLTKYTVGLMRKL